LLEHLLPPSDKICGCELLLPETAIFEGGKPKFIVKTDKDGCIVMMNKAKMGLEELRRTFATVVRERKKDLEVTS